MTAAMDREQIDRLWRSVGPSPLAIQMMSDGSWATLAAGEYTALKLAWNVWNGACGFDAGAALSVWSWGSWRVLEDFCRVMALCGQPQRERQLEADPLRGLAALDDWLRHVEVAHGWTEERCGF